MYTVCVCAVSSVTEEYHYELTYSTSEARADIEPAVALQLIEQHRDQTSALVCLAFHVVFAPFKLFKYIITRCYFIYSPMQ